MFYVVSKVGVARKVVGRLRWGNRLGTEVKFSWIPAVAAQVNGGWKYWMEFRKVGILELLA